MKVKISLNCSTLESVEGRGVVALSAIELRKFPGVDGQIQKLYVLNDVILCGHPTLLVTADGTILAESSAYGDFPRQLRYNFVGEEISVSSAILKHGSYCCLCGLWDDQFWHWMMEYLPRVVLAEEAGFKGTYLVPCKGSFFLESLHLLGIQEGRIEEFRGGIAVLEELYIPPAINGHHDLQRFPSLLSALRDQLLELSANSKKQPKSSRIYIARRIISKARRIIEEEALLNVLSKYEFDEVLMEEYPLKDQIALASRAKSLVGPHGAGMLHQLFMPPKSLVVELFSPHYVLTNNIGTLSILQHRYFSVVGQNGSLFPHPAGHDIRPNLMLLDAILGRELGKEFH